MSRIVVLLFVTFFLSFNASSSAKIVFLDMDFLLVNSIKGKKIQNDLEKINSENIKKLKLDEKNLKEEEEKIIKQKNILNEESYNEKVRNFEKKIIIYKDKKDEMVKEFNIIKDEKVKDFISQIEKLLSEYVKENKIDLVLNKKDILMGKNNYNITNDIMQIINNEN